MSPARKGPALAAGLALLAGGLAAGVTAPAAQAVSPTLVISEVYGAANVAPASYGNDFIEIYNPTANDVDVDGWSVQYKSAAGTGAFSVTPLSGLVKAGARYLVQEGNFATGTQLPTPDAQGAISMAAGAGVVALVSNTTSYPTFGSGTTPADLAGVTANGLVDVVGYGTTAITYETAATGVNLTSTTSAQRADADTDHNANDFVELAPTPEACGADCVDPVIPPDEFSGTIAEIQGTTDVSPHVGDLATTRGVVTAVYATGGLTGFYLQTSGTGGPVDATPGASDGIFVFGNAGLAAGPVIGDFVEVRGLVSEFNGLTELTPATGGVTKINDQAHIDPVPSAAPLPGSDCVLGACPSADDLATLREAHEGELYAPTGALTVTNSYGAFPSGSTPGYGVLYGQVGLATGSKPLVAPTEVADAQTGDIAGLTAYNNAHEITLDDGSSRNFWGTASAEPISWLSATQSVRVGAAVTLQQPVILDFRNNLWNIQPRIPVVGAGADVVTFEQTRVANAVPAPVGGDLKLGTFNVLNYFNTTGEEFDARPGTTCSFFSDRAGNRVQVSSCSPDGPRGAAQLDDFERQQQKIVTALNRMDADVVSLEEIENSVKLIGETDRDDALSALVSALNAAAGTTRWAYVPSPPASELPTLAEQDVIRNAFIYNPAEVELVGPSEVLVDSAAFANAREPLAQAFKAKGGDDADAFAVIVNHFKSKGSGVDDGTGQGAANPDRVAQAKDLAAFAAQFRSERGISKTFLTGDFNAYSEEDPVQELELAGYTELSSTSTPGEESYSFGGRSGSLDHVFANQAALANVTGVDVWDINASESNAFQYSRFNYNVTQLFDGSQPFAASDHNPELVGINVPDAANVQVTASPTTLKVKKDSTRVSVTVTSSGPFSPTGTVSAYVGTTLLGQATLVAGKATLTVGPFTTVGTKVIEVRYSGDANTVAGTGTVSVVVQNARPK